MFLNISCLEHYVSNTNFHILNVTFLEQFIFWMSSLWTIPCFECHFWNKFLYFEHHISVTFYILNVMFLKHFMYQTSHLWSISCFKHHVCEPFQCFERHVSWTFHVLSVMFLKQIFHFLNFTFFDYLMFWMSRLWTISCFECQVFKNFMFWTSRFWNKYSSLERQVSWTSNFERHVCEPHHVWNVTFLKQIFVFWTLHFCNTLCFERHISSTFHILTVTFQKHFMFWTSYFWNIHYF